MKRTNNTKAPGRRSGDYRSWNKNVRFQVNGRSKEQPFKSLQTYVEPNHDFSTVDHVYERAIVFLMACRSISWYFTTSRIYALRRIQQSCSGPWLSIDAGRL